MNIIDKNHNNVAVAANLNPLPPIYSVKVVEKNLVLTHAEKVFPALDCLALLLRVNDNCVREITVKKNNFLTHFHYTFVINLHLISAIIYNNRWYHELHERITRYSGTLTLKVKVI